MTRASRTSAATTLAALAALASLPLAALVSTPATAAAATPVGNCADLDSGRQVVPGNQDRIVVTATAGRLIAGYCVKSAGLKGTTGAPQYVTLVTPVAQLSLTHTDGGNLTHYSLTWAVPTPAPTEPAPTTPAPTEPAPTTPAPTEPAPTTPTDPAPTTPAPTVPANPPSSDTGSFDWNWTYADPACEAVTVAYPSDLPAGQSNDVNIRLETNRGQVSLNYHLDQGTWSGTVGFTYSQHRQWPAGVTDYTVSWIQVAGTNYHWQGALRCNATDDGDPTTYDAPAAVTRIDGFRSGTTTVARGRAAAADPVVVVEAGAADVVLQQRSGSTWRTVRPVSTTAGGAGRVIFPTQPRRGRFDYRLAVTGSEASTGATSRVLTVNVR